MLHIFDTHQAIDSELGDSNIQFGGHQPEDELGAAIAIVPDLTGNGIPELLIGAPGQRNDVISRNDGGVYLIPDLDLLSPDTTINDAIVHIQGDQTGSRLGSTVAGCADMDGDGLGEWAFAAPRDNSGEHLAGQVVLMLSGRNSLPDYFSTEVVHHWTGSIRGELAGHAISCHHDLTGDDIPDLVVSAPFSDTSSEKTDDGVGRIYILSGGDLPENGTLSEASSRTLYGLSRDAWMGWSIQTGDIDGDNHAEIVAGAPGMDDERGWVLIWDGSDVAQRGDLYPDFRLQGEQPGDRLGHRTRLDDLDGDGFLDLIVSAPTQALPENDTVGTVYIFEGRTNYSNWRPFMDTSRAITSQSSTLPQWQIGLELVSGDTNGDGAAELLIMEMHSKEDRP